MRFPAKFTPEPEGGFTVTFRDIPEAITHGDTMEEAISMAEDALITSMDFYFENKRSVPLPSKPKRGEHIIELPISIAAKVFLLNAMLESKVKNTDLAKQLGITRSGINRLLDLNHATKIDRISDALKILGKTLTVTVS